MTEINENDYMTDAKGRLIPKSMVKPQDQLRDQTVKIIVERFKKSHEVLKSCKVKSMQDISELEEIVAEKYQAKLGGKKGNLTLYSFDGKYKVMRSFADRIVFNEAAKSAEALFKECILEWGQGADPKLVSLVNYAFETDKQGNLSFSKIYSLLHYNINDEKWLRAKQAIIDSMNVAYSKSYIRVYERVGDTEVYKAIPLDIAADL
nr:MAG TPA: Protein of unknown function (DUF3164) [Caudoviricetes sp.]DAM07960.1 MAG TPA: Protein of unknown function (DUF3164) [Caudoviricetes sp.]